MITSYNISAYIREAVDSVLAQETDFDVELLIGDDGSTDGTLEILKEYEEKYPQRLRLFTAEESSSTERVSRAAANRLRLLPHARGEYCCFLDGDDYYSDAGRLKRMAAVLDAPANADCVMCATNVNMLWPDGHTQALSRARAERRIGFRSYWHSMFLQSNALMFRNIYAQHAPGGNLAELFDDNEITFWLFMHGDMYYLPECSVVYRQLPGSSWDGFGEARRHAVNITGCALESECRPAAHSICLGRSYPDLLWLYKHRNEWIGDELSPWPQLAEQKGWKEAQNVFRLCSGTEDKKLIRKMLAAGRREHMLGRAERVLRKLTGRY